MDIYQIRQLISEAFGDGIPRPDRTNANKSNGIINNWSLQKVGVGQYIVVGEFYGYIYLSAGFLSHQS